MTGAGASRVRWFLVFWLFILSAVSYLDRVNISIAGGSIAESYHLSDVQLGKVFSAMLVGYALFQTIGGRLGERFGPRRGLAGGGLWGGSFFSLCFDFFSARANQSFIPPPINLLRAGFRAQSVALRMV